MEWQQREATTSQNIDFTFCKKYKKFGFFQGDFR
jgi:hypothetical protein